MILKSLFFSSFLLLSITSHAGSVNWSLEPISLNLYAKNFDIKDAQVEMTCTLSDGAELVQKHPSVILNSTLTNQNFAGKGFRYLLETESANLSESALFASLRSCALILTVVSNISESVPGGESPVYREFGLVVSDGSSSEVQQFTVENQASIVMEKYVNGFNMIFDEDSYTLELE